MMTRPVIAEARSGKGGKADQALKGQPEIACFNGRLESRHSVEDGSEYLHFVFGGRNSEGQACLGIGVIDAEFIFLSGIQFSLCFNCKILECYAVLDPQWSLSVIEHRSWQGIIFSARHIFLLISKLKAG